MRTPAWAASGDSAATIPCREITIERPCERSCANAFSPKEVPITHTIQAHQAILRFTKSLRFGNFEVAASHWNQTPPANFILHLATLQVRILSLPFPIACATHVASPVGRARGFR